MIWAVVASCASAIGRQGRVVEIAGLERAVALEDDAPLGQAGGDRRS